MFIRHCHVSVDDIQYIYIDGLVQDCSNSSALAMELLQSCIEPSKCEMPAIAIYNVIIIEEHTTNMASG